ncbi:aconitate hydratase AcnA [Enterococcus sp. BWR-S5]|uniref:aconitate hydratase AcnA n=1 Tax=Enterococcus sp. BWR-S5 TaxID=2787714 RepID=UPI0019236F7F|nr:aconitate hydratase AcnA [Enterococcus sp. BWR-S5]MBL1226162.1 aconitate hydratase AcnA [Enterococcus sp. BWR-S5]
MLHKHFFERKGTKYYYDSLAALEEQYGITLSKLPYSIRVLLEGLIRQKNDFEITDAHIRALAFWNPEKTVEGEVPFKPARVILQDFTGVPVIVDLASLRETYAAFGGDPQNINPEIPVDLVIDHSVQVDVAGNKYALERNMKMEFQRNQERYKFLNWAQTAFDNYRVVPPATGIVHQVNIEYLADVVIQKRIDEETIEVYPDTLVGTDSHTTMVNGLGVLGWGVGGIEAEACMLGEPSYFPVPEVIGVRFINQLATGATATDLALKVTQVLRETKVVGKFVEFFGEGLSSLTLADRATVANMAPEYGATCGFFPVDDETIRYLELTGRDEESIAVAQTYLKENHLYYSTDDAISYSQTVEIDLSTIEPNLAGPKRPQDLIPLSKMKETFEKTFKADDVQSEAISVKLDGEEYKLKDGAVAIAAITSCTNTSNPHVMLSAGLVAKKAVEKGLKVPKFVKASLAPGSKVVTAYLENAGLLPYLEKLGFYVVGYGCTTCIGNSGSLREEIETIMEKEELLLAGVLSGNRNFEGRIHPLVKANYLASPPLVVLYALAGTTDIDLVNEPLGHDSSGEPVFLKDIWPEEEEIRQYVNDWVTPELFQTHYQQVFDANEEWNNFHSEPTPLYNWQESSTYIANPPYFEGMATEIGAIKELKGLSVLAKFGDSVTTDHISPAGIIQRNSPAGSYLTEHGVTVRDFNSYGSRRGHHEVMMRGTLANIRIRNQLVPEIEGGYTKYFPTGDTLSIYDAAMNYKEQGTGTIILAGEDYGMGSSRDWAAKGVQLLGVQAVIAKSYERIHRSNLVMMGILPLQYQAGEDAEYLGLDGTEQFDVAISEDVSVGDEIVVKAYKKNGEVVTFTTIVRFDSAVDVSYYQHGGILPMVIRKKLSKEAVSNQK